MRSRQHLLAPLFAACSLAAGVARAQEPPSFAGTWKIDPVDARKQIEAAGEPSDRIELMIERIAHQSFVFSATGDYASVYNGQATVAKWTQKSAAEKVFELQIDHADGRTEPLTITMLSDSRLRIAWGPRAFVLYKTSFLETWTPVAKLAIGSPAPPLVVEHWLQDDVAARSAFAGYEPGQVYVLECWATWCPPCVTGVPDLAALQQKYHEQGVTVLAVSNEPLARVEALIKRQLPPALIERAAAAGNRDAAGNPAANVETFGDLTRAFRLGADPDGSTWRDYLAAVDVAGVPTAFLIGRTGQLEWIGGPEELEVVLAQVVASTWDRDAYHGVWENQRRISPQLSRLKTLVSGGEHAEALAEIDQLLPLAQGRMRLVLEDLQLTAWVASHDARAVERLRDPAIAADLELALAAVSSVTQAASAGPLDPDVRDALEKLLAAHRRQRPQDMRILISAARLLRATGDRTAAIETLMGAAVQSRDDAERAEIAAMVEQFRQESDAAAPSGKQENPGSEER